MQVEDKMFDLMTKFYSEFSDFKTEVNAKLDILQSGQQKHENDITHIGNDIIRLENKGDNNSKALFDGYEQIYEKLLDIDKKVDVLSEKVEKHEVEIKL